MWSTTATAPLYLREAPHNATHAAAETMASSNSPSRRPIATNIQFVKKNPDCGRIPRVKVEHGACKPARTKPQKIKIRAPRAHARIPRAPCSTPSQIAWQDAWGMGAAGHEDRVAPRARAAAPLDLVCCRPPKPMGRFFTRVNCGNRPALRPSDNHARAVRHDLGRPVSRAQAKRCSNKAPFA